MIQNAIAPGGLLQPRGARGLGVDCGPMGGFDRAKVDEAFFGDLPVALDPPLVNLGYGALKSSSRGTSRLEFDDACRIV